MPIVNNMKYVHERRHFIGQAADDDLAKATSLIVKKKKLNVTTAIDKNKIKRFWWLIVDALLLKISAQFDKLLASQDPYLAHSRQPTSGVSWFSSDNNPCEVCRYIFKPPNGGAGMQL